MFNFIKSISRKKKLKNQIAKVKSSLTQLGSILEIRGGAQISLLDGSTKDDIVVHNNVMLLDCSILSTCGGKVLLGNYVKIGQRSNISAVERIEIGDYKEIKN